MKTGWLSRSECERLWFQLNEPNTDPHQSESVIGQSIRFGGGFYQFGPLVPLYGSDFVFPLILHFTNAFSGNAASGNSKRLLALRYFLEWVALSALKEPHGSAAKVHRQFLNNTCPRADDMNAISADYGDVIRNFADMSVLKSANKVYRATHLETVSAVLRNLAPYGMWPLIHPIRRIDDREGGHILTLGQLGPGRTKVVFEGADAYARSVEASRIRMAQLRTLAEKRLLHAYEKFENGKRLLALDSVESLELIKRAVLELTAYGDNKNETPLVEAIFPKDNPDQRLANLLTYLDAMDNGAVPRRNEPGGSYGLDLLIRACGGRAFVSEHLQGSKTALLCSQLITLIDTGLNVQPCAELAAQPIAGEFRRGKATLMGIEATKNRPKTKRVFTAVPIEGAEALLNVPGFKVSTKAALTMWQEMSHRMRIRAERQGGGIQHYLWICYKGTGYSGPIKLFTDTTAKSQIDIFIKEIANDPVMGGIRFSRRNIRPTYLSLRNAKNMDHQVVVALANHSDARVTFGAYVNQAEFKGLLASEIRRFQNRLESAILVTDLSRVVHLCLSAETVVGRAEAAIHSGLDEILFDSSNVKAAAIEATAEVEILPDELANFLRLDPNPTDLIALWLFKQGLETAQEEFLVSNPRRWRSVWLPCLVLCVAAISRVEQSRYQTRLKRALLAAEEGVRNGTMRKFVPW